MLAFPSMLESAAKEAGIPIPEDCDNYLPRTYPQFHLFCCGQLSRRMSSPGEHWENAKIIAKIKPEDCETMTWEGLRSLGFQM